MTGAELKKMVEQKRAEGQELLSIMFDNSLYAYFTKDIHPDVPDHIFDTSKIRQIGGVDCVETELLIQSQVIGHAPITMTTVHPTDMIQALMFVPKDKWEEVDPRELNANYC